MSDRSKFGNPKLIYKIYCELYEAKSVASKGQEDVRHIAFGRIYYQLAEYPWKSIGITKNLLKELEQNNFDRKNISMTRSHVYHRREFLSEIFKKPKKTESELLAFLWEKDVTIMSLSYENTHIDKTIDKEPLETKSGKMISEGCYLFTPQDYENFFPAKQVGWKYTKKVIEKLKDFSKTKDKVEIKSNNNKGDWKIINKW